MHENMSDSDRKNNIKDYWNDRAKRHRMDPQATTNDVYLRELEVRTILKTIDEVGFPEDSQMLDLGCTQLYYHGKGVPQDYREAAKRLRLPAEQGEPFAQALLGTMYLHGEGLPQDYALAAKWSLMGAKQGISQAQRNLGRMYVFGWGVPKDYTLAHKWLNLAAAAGDSYSATARDKLQKIMTSSQIKEAQRLARDWKPQKPLPAPSPRLPSLY